MSITYILDDETATLQLGKTLAPSLQAPLTVFLQGALGAGKTTLVRGILTGLGYTGTVKSPTYTLVETYTFPQFELFHFDFYRITNEEELLLIGIEDYFSENSIRLIEWPERAPTIIKNPDLICQLTLQNEGRLLNIYQSHYGFRV